MKNQGSLHLNSLLRVQSALQCFVHEIDPSQLLDIEKFTFQTVESDDINTYIYKMIDKIKSFMKSSILESNDWKNYISIFKANHFDDDSQKVHEGTNETANNIQDSQNKSNSDKKNVKKNNNKKKQSRSK